MAQAGRGARVLRTGLEQAVFNSLYQSRRQRWRRRMALGLLLIKHMLRGLMVLWPVCLVLILVLLIPAGQHHGSYYNLALLPGSLLWLFVFIRGARRDYRREVNGRLLNKGYIARLLFR